MRLFWLALPIVLLAVYLVVTLNMGDHDAASAAIPAFILLFGLYAALFAFNVFSPRRRRPRR